jgi:hypothetical protein
VDLSFTPSELAFRDELRAWFAANPPGEMPAGDDERYEWSRTWQARLHDGGWAGVHWPKEYGGRGASLFETAIFFEELGRANAPLPANVLGLLLGGPTVMFWGTEAQKERYLTPILSAEEIWCQGFSEPGAGSDLAAVQTRAIKDGGGWRVTGQKVWTSGAQYSKWCMLVARTDLDVPKHKGLTYFLLDMDQAEVQVRPLVQITGEAEFNELFLEERLDPRRQRDRRRRQRLEGRAHDAHERARRPGVLPPGPHAPAARRADRRRRRERRARRSADRRQARRPARPLRDAAAHGLQGPEHDREVRPAGPEGSLTKWLWSESNQQLVQVAADIVGPTR